jgi:uncharacterized protein YcaQ
MITITPTIARRLAITKQRLAGRHRPAATPDGIMEIVRDLGGLQLDPTNRVARSHLLVLWSRLGPFDPTHLDTLLWQEHRLFEYGAYLRPATAYPFYRWRMNHFATGDTAWEKRARHWLTENLPFRAYILDELSRRGPLGSKDLEDRALTPWQSSGWTNGRNLSQMLEFMTDIGELMVAGRQKGQRLWDLPERCLPAQTPRPPLSDQEATRWIAEHGVQRQGIAHLNHFPVQHRPAVLALAQTGLITELHIEENGRSWPGPWYIHQDDLPLLPSLEDSEWQPHTTLLSPFDTLIQDRDRTQQLFNFHYRLEIYVPKEKRQYGYFVLPILHGDRLIGRLDPEMDHRRRLLTIHAIYAEPDAPQDEITAAAIAAAIQELATFLQANSIQYPPPFPPAGAAYYGKRVM